MGELLYVGNTSKQVWNFLYRMPEETVPRAERIEMGNQIIVTGEPLERPEIDFILGQYRRYGIKSLEEMQRNRAYVGLVYNIGKPIPFNKPDFVDETYDTNDRQLDLSASKQREEVAASLPTTMNQEMRKVGVRADVKLAEVEIVERPASGGQATVAEGFEVATGEDPPASRRGATISERARTALVGKRKR